MEEEIWRVIFQVVNELRFSQKDYGLSNQEQLKKIALLEEKGYKDEKQKEELFNKIQFYDQT